MNHQKSAGRDSEPEAESFFTDNISMKKKNNLYIILAFIVSALFAFLMTGCKGEKKQQHDNLPEDVKPVAIAIIEDSPSEFAKAVSYPIQRPYPLHDIKDSAEMVKYYPTLVDDSLKNVVRQTPDSLWQQFGWRGWSLSDGSYLWVDAGKIYAIDYLSAREKEQLDSLRKKEISSLTPNMRKGWVPVLCVIDTVDGDLFRIDIDSVGDSNLYRLAGYASTASLSGPPSILLYGHLDEEGSMSTRLYHFADSTGTKAEYSPDILEDDSVPTIEMVKRGKTKKIPVKPTYWLDHLKRDSLRTEAEAEAISPSADHNILHLQKPLKPARRSDDPDSIDN